MTGGPDNRFLYLVEDHGEVLLRAARVLCGDWAQAEDLLQTALSRSLARWEAGLSDEESLVAMRQEVVVACLESFPEHHDMTFRSTSEPPGSLLAQLHELDPTAHAALVAMYYLDLTAWQAADAIGSVPNHTADVAERCLAWLDTPEETFQVQLDTELGPTPPSPADRLEWVTRGASPESHGHGHSTAPLGRLTPRVAATLTIALLSTSLAAALVLNAGGKDNDRHESTPPDSVEVDTVPTLPERVPAARTLSGTSAAPSSSATASASASPTIATTARPPRTDSANPPPAQQPTTPRPGPTSSSPRPPTSTSPKPKPTTPPKTTRPPTPTTSPPTTPSTSPTPTVSPSPTDPSTGQSSASATSGATSTNPPTGTTPPQTGSTPASP